MDENLPTIVVRTEREEGSGNLTAVFSGVGALALKIAEQLSSQGVAVSWAKSIEEVSGLFEAKLLFLFLDEAKIESEGEVFLRKYASQAVKLRSKLVVIFEQVQSEEQKKVERLFGEVGVTPEVVEIRSKLQDGNQISEVGGKIVRMAMSSRANERLVVGDFSKEEVKGGYSDLQSGVIVSKKEEKKTGTKRGIQKGVGKIAWVGVFVAILLLPLGVAALAGAAAMGNLWQAKQAIAKGEYKEAQSAAVEARGQFGRMSDVCVGLPVFGTEPICQGLSGMGIAADTLFLAANLEGRFLALGRSFFSPEAETPNLRDFASATVADSGRIDENLSFLAAIVAKEYGLVAFIADKLGVREEVDQKLAQFPKLQFLARAGREMTPVTLPVLGVSDGVLGEGKRKTYLVVFQNSAELRGGGGFIGSYAIIHVDSGKLLDFKINDIYTIDGQLKGKVTPPDEILHYLGQPSWFMRDANFAPDFPLSAKRLAWFLEKETGQSVDGVIAINLPAVEKILEGMGEVRIQSDSEPITAKNFFQKAEYASEINFFPGSTQKRDFLGEVAEAILGRLVNEQNLNYDGLAESLADAFWQKDIMFYFTAPYAQKAVEEAGLSGSIMPSACSSGQNCLMVVEDNFGANKANFFVKKKMEVTSEIDKGGGVVNTVKVTFNNESPNESWPGGKYKNYLRFLMPEKAEMVDINLGDERKASVAGVLNADRLAKVGSGEFLVYKSEEQVLRSDSASMSGYMSFGMLVEIPVKTRKMVEIKYKLANQLDFGKESDRYRMTLLKQSGSVFDPLRVTIGFPTFLEPELSTSPFEAKPIVKPQELIYNTVLDRDRTFDIKFKQD